MSNPATVPLNNIQPRAPRRFVSRSTLSASSSPAAKPAKPFDLLQYTPLEVRHLRLVCAVVEARTLAGAATRLHLTTSALSHQLQQLEHITGTRIFDRGPSGMRVTRAGKILLDAARQTLALLLETEKNLGRADSHPKTIRLGAHCFTGYDWLSPLLKRSKRRRSQFELEIVTDTNRKPFESLLAGKVDVVLTFDPPASDAFKCHQLLRDEIVLLVHRDHRLAGRSAIELTDLSEEHLLMYSERFEHSPFAKEFLLPRNVYPRAFTSVAATDAMFELVEAGVGVMVLARWAAAKRLRTGRLVATRLARRGIFRSWYAVTRSTPKEGIPELVRDLRSHMRSTYAKETAGQLSRRVPRAKSEGQSCEKV
jgi:LysR family transcriptional regulator for metE and metH